MSTLAWLLAAVSTYAVIVTLLHIIQGLAVVDVRNRAEVQRMRAERAENTARTLQHIAHVERRGAGR